MSKIDNGEYMGQRTSDIVIELMKVIEEFCPSPSPEVDVYPALMAAQMVTESIAMRLRKMEVDEELITVAKENAINNIVLLMAERDGKFTIKGEEV